MESSVIDEVVSDAEDMVEPVKILLQDVRQGLQQGQIPSKTDMLDCTGGVYFMKSVTGGFAGVFKPADEEQGMPNNPKGHAGDGAHGLRPFLKPGYGYMRETAAYLLDEKHFCSVPTTGIVRYGHPSFHYQGYVKRVFPKIGSVQRYIRASDTFEDISPSLISTFELQKIALLDIRYLNCDRNASNILAIRNSESYTAGSRKRRDSRSGSMGSYSTDPQEDEMEFNPFYEDISPRGTYFELIPIDHGYCFPSKLQISEFDWAWLDCAQISQKVDPEIKKYIESLDIDALLAKLPQHEVVLPAESIFLVKVVHKLLVEGIANGLTLRDIALMIVRVNDDEPSPLEVFLENAEENAYRSFEFHNSRSNSKTSNVLNDYIHGKSTHYDPNYHSSLKHSTYAIPETTYPGFPIAFTDHSASKNSEYNYSPTDGLFEEDDVIIDTEYNSEPFTSQLNADKLARLNLRTSSTPNFENTYENFVHDSAKLNGKPLTSIISIDSSLLNRPDANVLSKKRDHVLETPQFVDKDKSIKKLRENKLESTNSVFSSFTSQAQKVTSDSSSSTSVRVEDDFFDTQYVDISLSLTTENSYGSHSSAFTDQSLTSRISFSPEMSPTKTTHGLPCNILNQSPCADTNHIIHEKLIILPTQEPIGSSGSRSSSPNDENDNDNDNTTDIDTDDIPLSVTNSTERKLFQQIPFTKVVSFSAFESPSLYEFSNTYVRHLSKLRKEKRKQFRNSKEFVDTRLLFANESISSMIVKACRAKNIG
eukprot:gene13576-18219_t